MRNPFKFGTVVDGAFFTDREKELQTIGQLLESENQRKNYKQSDNYWKVKTIWC